MPTNDVNIGFNRKSYAPAEIAALCAQSGKVVFDTNTRRIYAGLDTQSNPIYYGSDINTIDWNQSTGVLTFTMVNGTTQTINVEQTSNKVTSWSQTTTDTHYPSEKLVKDSLDTKVIEAGAGTNSAVQIGLANSATGTGAIAVNGSNAASGENSLAEGSYTRSTGRASHAEGNTTLASGDYSHAEGAGSGAIGVASHAEGNGTSAQNFAEHAEGSHNVTHIDSEDFGSAGNTIHSIGIGTGLQSTKNAVEVMQNGDVYILGIGNYDGSDISSSNSVQNVLDGKQDTITDLSTIRTGSMMGLNSIQEPEDEGDNGQVLTTDGNGNRSWTTVNALPSQSGQSGKFLTTDGTTASWASVSAGASIIEKTYSELVAMRNGETLQPGQLYRITDYVTTTIQSNTRSAGHAFDLIVLATSSRTLDSQAKAINHDGDTYFSTNNADLSKWQIWYDINNDTSKYAWADSINGKGVIYRMIDEWGNDCPYDFKNIQFMVGEKTQPGTYDGVYYYTFSYAYDMADTSVDDYSFNGNVCNDNVIKNYLDEETLKITLNANVFRNTSNDATCQGNTFGNECYGNTFGDGCIYNTFGDGCIYNTFGDGCYSNTFGNSYRFNTFGIYCYSNTFGNYCQFNTFGDGCYSNTFGNYCQFNTFGIYCYSNTFGNYCRSNTFGDGCFSNTFGNYCQFNTFGNSSKQYGNYCFYNIFENGCSYIRLYNPSTASENQALQNITVCQGVSGISSNYIEISTIDRNLGYQTKVAKNSNGDLKIYCEADLIQ